MRSLFKLSRNKRDFLELTVRFSQTIVDKKSPTARKHPPLNSKMAAAMGSHCFFSAPLRPSSAANPRRSRWAPFIYARFERPLEEIYNVRVERAVPRERLAELGVDRWSGWRTGRCRLPWDWHVDQQVYLVSGEVRVVPDGAPDGERYMRFVAGDLVRYPQWFEADLFFDGPYEERYRFLAYGEG